MKKIILVLVLATVALPGAAEGLKEVGVGVVAGDPIGGTAKLWLDRDLAFDVGVGFSGDAVFWKAVRVLKAKLLEGAQ